MGAYEVRSTEDPGEALAAAGDFLVTNPVEHNLLLTLLHDRIAVPLAGRYWWASDRNGVTGFVLQSPRSFSASITPTAADVLRDLVDVVAADAPDLPGVMGDAPTASVFAGCWTDRLPVAARPKEGGRLYQLDEVVTAPRVPGDLRPAQANDRDALVRWLDDFQQDTGDGPGDPSAAVDRRLREERLWVWDDSAAVSMAVATRPVAGVTRIGWVYTPPERRSCGYASACVAALSEHVLANEAETCILYTQLGNPTSNAIYRRIGYEPIAEIISYQFAGA
jgi:uncharacterized protein